jgi:hypothetical protein
MTKYELFNCDTSGEHKPIAKFESDESFMAVQIGERFDDQGWDRLDGVGVIASDENPKRYIVHSVKHVIKKQGEVLVVQYWVNLKPFDGARSPAWSD